MLTLVWAAAHTKSISLRAIYLEQALEEARHARMFSCRAAELSGNQGAEPAVHADAEDLHRALGEVRFLTFLGTAERQANIEFAGYRDAFARSGDACTARVFDAILEDEQKHERYPLELVRELGGDVAAPALEVAVWRAWRTFRRLGRTLAERVYVLGMIVVYVLVAPLALWVRWVRPEPRRLLLSPEWTRRRERERS